MNATEYLKRALGVERQDHAPVIARLCAPGATRLVHGMVGLCTETGEIQDALKRHFFYGKPIDPVNLKEELGDVMWYIAIMCDELGISLGDVMEANIAKLEKRYAGGFTEQKAVNRDLETERAVLESKKE
jgi:NTP pyrophosphatase (non-canonical NTP hydrolase)